MFEYIRARLKDQNLMSYAQRCFISGILVWVPILVTLLVLKFLVDLLSKSLLLLPARFQPDHILGFHVPGVGVLLTILIVFITGMVVANYLGQRMMEIGDAIVARIPLVRSIYTGVKKVTETLFTPGGQSFRKVLLVEFPTPGVWSVAFQTNEGVKELEQAIGGGEPMVSYFIPTTPNPTSGFLMVAPKSKVIELDTSVDQALKYVISLGVVQPMSHPSAAGFVIKK